MQLRSFIMAVVGISMVVEATFTAIEPRQLFGFGRTGGRGRTRGDGRQRNEGGRLNNENSRSSNRNGNKQNNNNRNNNNGNNNKARDLCLRRELVQSASTLTGEDPRRRNSAVAKSKTDNANFINFCVGQTLTDGRQIREGSCNSIVMGQLPSSSRMVSTLLVSPSHNTEVPAYQDFNIEVRVAHMQTGAFTNPLSNYYSAPQQLNSAGEVIGHVHVTVQDLGASLMPSRALDASRFVFFKGIDRAARGSDGRLTTTVTGGLPPGNYRVCTISSAANHQPVLMPVAQRGAQDDCQRFVVIDDNNNSQRQRQNPDRNTRKKDGRPSRDA